jgi:2-dehydropantoate 2-reductase
MKILIYGSGGVGGYFGARLLESGNELVFVARGKHKEHLERSGIFLKSFLGDYRNDSISVVEDLGDLNTLEFGLVIIACKWDDLEGVAKQLSLYSWTENCLFLPLLNGVENSKVLSQHLPQRQVLGGLCRIISYIESPGIIFHEDVVPSIYFGHQDNGKSPDLGHLEKLFSTAGINASWVDDIQLEIWKKFAFICSVSALGALVRMPIGSYRTGYLRVVIQSTLEEISKLAEQEGVILGPDYIEAMMAIIDKQDPESTASLQRDIMSGKPSELWAQNGSVIRLAKQYGLKTPMNTLIFELLKPQENFNRAKKK